MAKSVAKRVVARATAKKIRKRARKAPAPKTKPRPGASGTKLDLMVAALSSSKGASITKLIELTGWQMHSVRGALAGALKKKRGLKISSAKVDGQRIYRIEAAK